MARRTRSCTRCGGSGIEPDPALIGSSMRDQRIRAGLTLREIARRTGFSAPYISDLERGNRPWGLKASVKYREALK